MNLLEGHERVEEVEEEEEKQKGGKEEEEDKVLMDELQVQKFQEEAGLKQAKRTDMIGQLLRSKGDLLLYYCFASHWFCPIFIRHCLIHICT